MTEITNLARRHRWSPPQAFVNERGEHWKSERTCQNIGCTVVKVTRHQWAERQHWIEFHDRVTLERIDTGATPECTGVSPMKDTAA